MCTMTHDFELVVCSNLLFRHIHHCQLKTQVEKITYTSFGTRTHRSWLTIGMVGLKSTTHTLSYLYPLNTKQLVPAFISPSQTALFRELGTSSYSQMYPRHHGCARNWWEYLIHGLI